MDKPIRLLIADDHTLFREGVKALLSTTPDIEVVGEASSGTSIVTQFRLLQPQVVLMDIHMPDSSGIEATRAILDQDPQAGVIMVTMLEDDASVFAAMRAGARGYVLKGAHPQEMLNVIRVVAEGEALFGPAIALRIAHFFHEESGKPTAPTMGTSTHEKLVYKENELSELSEREREVLDLIAAGYNNTEIALKLVISPNTVRNHITNIFSKLQVADRAQAIRRARQGGLG